MSGTREFNYNNQKFFLPTCWETVTVEQFLKLFNNPRLKLGDVLEAASLFSGLDYDFFYRIDPNDKVVEEILECLTFINVIPDFKKLAVPKSISIGGKDIDVPEDLTLDCWGQKILFEKAYENALKQHGDPLPMMDELLAIYFCTRITGKEFSEKDLPEANRLMGLASIMQAYPIANFFLNRYIESMKKIKNSSKQKRTQKKMQPA